MPDPANTDQLLGRLLGLSDGMNARLSSLEDFMRREFNDLKSALHGRVDEHDRRISERFAEQEIRLKALELKQAEAKGGVRILFLLGGALAAVGGVIGNLLGKVWPTP